MIKMPFHGGPITGVAVQMGISFAFWWVLAMIMGGDRYAPALIGAGITGVRGAMGGGAAVGTLPDNLGVVTAKPSYASGASGRRTLDITQMAISAGSTFVVWLIAGYFLISGSAWKYASAAATVAASPVTGSSYRLS